MKVILGTYRGPDYVARALESLKARLKGWDDLTIIDDSGNRDWVNVYQTTQIALPNGKSFFPKVVSFDKRGYNVAMREVCLQARGERFLFWEEDFILEEVVDLHALEAVLESRPSLAQIALQRQPWFPNELEVGSMLEALKLRKPHHLYLEVEDGIVVQDAIFTCNPAVWQSRVSLQGWPHGRWSEETMTASLLGLGYQFAFWPGITVTHEGERSGHGY